MTPRKPNVYFLYKMNSLKNFIPKLVLLGSPCFSDCIALIDDLELVPSGSPQAFEHRSDLARALSFQRAKPVPSFVERFHGRFKKYARIDHSAAQIDCCELRGLFD